MESAYYQQENSKVPIFEELELQQAQLQLDEAKKEEFGQYSFQNELQIGT